MDSGGDPGSLLAYLQKHGIEPLPNGMMPFGGHQFEFETGCDVPAVFEPDVVTGHFEATSLDGLKTTRLHQIGESSTDVTVSTVPGLENAGHPSEFIEFGQGWIDAKITIIDVDHQQASAGTQDASGLAQRRDGVRQVLKQEPGVDEVEAVVFERQAMAVGLDEASLRSMAKTIPFRSIEKRRIQVDSGDLRVRGEFRHFESDRSGTAGEIEDVGGPSDASAIENVPFDVPPDGRLGDEPIEFGGVVLEFSESIGSEIGWRVRKRGCLFHDLIPVLSFDERLMRRRGG